MLSVGRAQATGLADIVQRMLDFTEHLRRLEVDCYEYVALKVLMLLSPGEWSRHYVKRSSHKFVDS